MADEKTREQREAEREAMIQDLMPEDLEKLTDYQLRVCNQIQVTRVNKRARDRVDEVLDDQLRDLAQALTTPPYVYTSPEIKVMAGCTVRFKTLMKTQLEDAHTQLDHFIAEERPNDIRSTDYLNSLLTAHALDKFNGADFGGVCLDAESYQMMVVGRPDEAKKLLEEVRNKRLQALGNMSPQVTQRLFEYYHAFQMAIEALSKGDEMEEVLGN